MRLSILNETTRRDFLKTAGSMAATAVAPGGMAGGLLKLAGGSLFDNSLINAYLSSGIDADTMEEAVFSLANTTSPRGDKMSYHLDHERLLSNGITPDIMSGYLMHSARANPGQFVASLVTSESDLGGLNEFTNNITNKLIGSIVAQIGPKGIFKAVADNYGVQCDDTWYAFQSLAHISPNFADGIGVTPELLDRFRDNIGAGARFFHKQGLLDEKDVKKAVQTHYKNTELRKKWNAHHKAQEAEKAEMDRKDKLEKEKSSKAERRSSESPERIEPTSDDYLDASSMHQPFEVRLRNALGIIF